jgi:hypothetical protein
MKRTINTLALVLALSATCIGQTIAGLDPEPPKVVAPVAHLRVQAAVELKTGERIDGQFGGASLDGVLFQTAGQTITISFDKVRAIYFGKAPAPEQIPEQKSATQPPPADDHPGITTDDERAFLLAAARRTGQPLAKNMKTEPSPENTPTLGALTREQAYNVAVNCISSRLKAPSTARFSPMNEATYAVERPRGIFGTKGKEEFINVRLLVDAQNGFGAMLRERWLTQISMDGLRCFCISLR